MKTKKLLDSLLVALMLSFSFALTSCDDDDDDKGGSSSSLSRTAWFGEDNNGNYYSLYFYKNDFSLSGYNCACEGDFSVRSGKIKFSDVDGWGSPIFKEGTFEYRISGRKGDRELVIYDALQGSNDLYLEEIEYSGSFEDWDYDW